MRAISRLRGRQRRAGVLFVGLPALLIMAACGSGDSGSNVDDAISGSNAAVKAPQSLIDQAKKEGKVVIYSSQLQDQLEDFAAGFEKLYPGISVDAIRVLDQDAPAKIEAEKDNGIADLYVGATLPPIENFAKKNYFAAPTGPEFSSAAYRAGKFLQREDYFEVGAAILAPEWNTDELPSGITSYRDLLDPKLSDGKIGLPAITAGSYLDMYLYLQDNFGEGFLKRLAAQHPRLYATTSAAGQAVVSGEISVAAFAPPPVTDMAKGAPVKYTIPKPVWGTRYYGGVLSSAPHPAAAQLIANFMITRAGQQLVQRDFSSIYDNIPGALSSDASVRRQDVSRLTPEAVTAFAAQWKHWGAG